MRARPPNVYLPPSPWRPLATPGARVDALGNIRSTYIKRIAILLVERHPNEFTDDYDHNKKKVSELTDVRSIMMRNRIAGYVTRYRQRKEA